MVDGEKRQLETVGDAGFVVDAAQVIFNDLLLGAELTGDVLIFAALDDEGDDLHFLGRKAVSNTGSHGILGLHGGEVGALYKALPAGDLADALDELRAADAAGDDTLKLAGDLGVDFLGVLRDEDGAAAGEIELGDEGKDLQAEARGEEDNGSAEGVDGVEELIWIFALGDDAEVILKGEDASGSRAKDCLIVSQNESVHRVFDLLLFTPVRYKRYRQELENAKGCSKMGQLA